MPITTVSNLILLTGAFFGHFSSSWSTVSPSSLISMLLGSSRPVCIFVSPFSIADCRPPRHQYPFVCGLILWLQNCHAHQNLETFGNGLCHCQFLLDDTTSFQLTISPFLKTGYSYCGRNRTTTDPTKEHLGAYCRHPFLSKYCDNSSAVHMYITKIIFYYPFIVSIRSSLYREVPSIFRNLPCIQTRYILSCLFRFTMRRLSTPKCSVINIGCGGHPTRGDRRLGWMSDGGSGFRDERSEASSMR